MLSPPSVLSKIDHRQPRTHQVCEALRAAILDLRLKPGAPISENGICRQTSVSRTPVREALIRLAQEGLIDVFPQHGSFIAKISATRIMEGLFVRQTLELAMLRKAAAVWTAENTLAVETMLALQRAYARTRDYQGFHREDERFHHYFAQVAGLAGVSRVIVEANTHVTRVRQLANPVKGHMARAVREHGEILAAVKAGKVDAASAILSHHLERIPVTVKKLMRHYAEYFEDEGPPRHKR
jgi:GntR family transcriptional regulator, rspAB operon transcriptional repressor